MKQAEDLGADLHKAFRNLVEILDDRENLVKSQPEAKEAPPIVDTIGFSNGDVHNLAISVSELTGKLELLRMKHGREQLRELALEIYPLLQIVKVELEITEKLLEEVLPEYKPLPPSVIFR
jgi:hypothetical protein